MRPETQSRRIERAVPLMSGTPPFETQDGYVRDTSTVRWNTYLLQATFATSDFNEELGHSVESGDVVKHHQVLPLAAFEDQLNCPDICASAWPQEEQLSRKRDALGALGSRMSSGFTIPRSAASVSPLASTTTPGQSRTRTPFSSTTSWTSFVHPGVGATEHALDRLSVLIRLLLPTLGCPIRPIVRLCFTLASFAPLGAPELRKPLMSSMRGFVEDPEAEVGVWSDEAERWVRCCCVDDLKAIVGACRRRCASQSCTTGGGTRSAHAGSAFSFSLPAPR